jgi:hypothetical protein
MEERQRISTLQSLVRLRPGLEPAIYRYRGDHTNHYITDAFEPEVNMIFHFNKISYYENDHQ